MYRNFPNLGGALPGAVIDRLLGAVLVGVVVVVGVLVGVGVFTAVGVLV